MKNIQTLGVIATTALLVGGITNIDAKGTKKTHVSKKEPVKGKLNHEEAIKKIRAALQAGKLSREEAAKKIAAVKKEFGNKKNRIQRVNLIRLLKRLIMILNSKLQKKK